MIENKIIKEGNNHQVQIYTDGWRYSHSISFISENHEWYLEVFALQMQEVHDRSYKKGKDEIKNGIKSLLDIKEQ